MEPSQTEMERLKMPATRPGGVKQSGLQVKIGLRAHALANILRTWHLGVGETTFQK